MEKCCSKNRAKIIFVIFLLITLQQVGFIAKRMIVNEILGSLVLIICFIPSVIAIFYVYGKWMSNVIEEHRSGSETQRNIQTSSVRCHSYPNHTIYSIVIPERDNFRQVQNSQIRSTRSEAYNINLETIGTSGQILSLSTSDDGPPPSYSQLNSMNKPPPTYEDAIKVEKDLK